MVNDIGHIFGKIVLFLRGGSQCDKFAKIQAGTSAYFAKIRALYG